MPIEHNVEDLFVAAAGAGQLTNKEGTGTAQLADCKPNEICTGCCSRGFLNEIRPSEYSCSAGFRTSCPENTRLCRTTPSPLCQFGAALDLAQNPRVDAGSRCGQERCVAFTV